jgi:general secretion pathway protein D
VVKPSPQPVPGGGEQPVTATPAPVTAPAETPVLAGAAPVQPPVPAGAAQQQPSAAEGAAVTTKATVNMNAPALVKANEKFSIELHASAVENLAGASLFLRYDPNVVDFVDAAEGGILKQGGVATQFQTPLDRANNMVSIILKRPANAVGASGEGTLATVNFKALKPGTAKFDFQFGYLYPPTGKSVRINPPAAVVEVK